MNELIAMASPGQGAAGWVGFVPFALILGIFYFLILLPMKKRQKKVQEFQEALKVGDKVVTTSGIYGQITKVNDKSVQHSRADCMLMIKCAQTLALKAPPPEDPAAALARFKTKEDEKEVMGRLHLNDQASDATRFEEAGALRDLLSTVEEMEERQKMAAAKGDDIDIFAAYAEPPLVALNLFHLRNGQIVDRREFFWEDQHEFDEPQFFSALIKQIYIDQQHIPSIIHVPVDFEDREALEELLSEKRGRKVEIHTPQRGQKKALLNLVETNAKHSFDQRFRVMKPSSRAIQEALQDALGLPRRSIRGLTLPGFGTTQRLP